MTQRADALYAVGDELPVLVKSVTQEKINRYAVSSGDHNPLHTDPKFAATTRFGGPVYGMLVLAYLRDANSSWRALGSLMHEGASVRHRGRATP